jgi:formyltetrahydrofolate-dependent phosphoribosylglycinamide formyltransferase
MKRARVAVLASGGGSNLQALIDHASALGDARAWDIVLVGSDQPASGALARARAAGIDAALIESRSAPHGAPMDALLRQHDVDLLVLAGYLRLVPAEVTRRLPGRLLNVHPAPLPAFGGAGMYGARVHRAVLAAGAPMSGPTVHFVDEEYDRGPIVAYWPVPVLPDDDEHALAARVLRAEHLLYPRVVQAVAAGEVALRDGRVTTPYATAPLPPFDPTLDDASLSRLLDHAHSSEIH